MGTLMWAVANVLIGVCAILPLGLGSKLVFGRPDMFQVGDGRAASATGIVLVTLGVLGVLFVLVNVPFRRRLPPGAANAVWPAAAVLALVPFVIVLVS
jgi:hypothetical protein